MSIPIPSPAAAMKKLDETNPAFDEAPGRQALFAELFRFLLINAVKRPRLFRFFFELQRFGNRSLHLKGEFVALDPGAQVLVIRIINPSDAIEFAQQT